MTNRVSRTISDDTLNRIIQIESAGNPLAAAATSSARGLGQFLNATWLTMVKKHRPEWLKGRTRAEVLDLRFDASCSIEMLARLAEDNARAIGGQPTPGDLYLAHFLGPADARDLFRADPGTPVAKLVSAAVIRANRSIMEGKTAGEVRAWAARKMAQAPKADWVAKFYTGKVYRPLGVVADPADDAKGRPADDPVVPDDPPAAPETVPDPVPEVTPAPPADTEVIVTPQAAGGFFPWLGRVAKSKLTWASSAMGGVGMASFMEFITDWRTIAALIALIIVCYLIYRFGRK